MYFGTIKLIRETTLTYSDPNQGEFGMFTVITELLGAKKTRNLKTCLVYYSGGYEHMRTSIRMTWKSSRRDLFDDENIHGLVTGKIVLF